MYLFALYTKIKFVRFDVDSYEKEMDNLLKISKLNFPHSILYYNYL